MAPNQVLTVWVRLDQGAMAEVLPINQISKADGLMSYPGHLLEEGFILLQSVYSTIAADWPIIYEVCDIYGETIGSIKDIYIYIYIYCLKKKKFRNYIP